MQVYCLDRASSAISTRSSVTRPQNEQRRVCGEKSLRSQMNKAIGGVYTA